MTAAMPGSNSVADDLRRAFDASFAAPPSEGRQETDSFLALSLGGDGYAIRIGEIDGLTAARKIVPIASPVAEMLGLAGVRGNLVAVYSLAALLGYGLDRAPPRWFVQCRGTPGAALAFADLDGYIELARPVLHPAEAAADRSYIQDVLGEASRVRAVIGIAMLVDAIDKKVAAAAFVKES